MVTNKQRFIVWLQRSLYQIQKLKQNKDLVDSACLNTIRNNYSVISVLIRVIEGKAQMQGIAPIAEPTSEELQNIIPPIPKDLIVDTPKKRGRKPSEIITEVQPQIDTPKKRGRKPKEVVVDVQSNIDTPKKRGRKPTEVVADVQSNIDTPKKRGRKPKEVITEVQSQIDTPKKRGRKPKEITLSR